MELAMLPLMGHTLAMRRLLEAALPVADRLEEGLRAPVRAAMLCMGYGELQGLGEREWARGELLGMPVVGQELFEDLVRDGIERGRREGRQEGRQEGELHLSRVWLLDAFAARFTDAPATVRDAVAASNDRGQLSRWFRAVIQARDVAEATRAILGEG